MAADLPTPAGARPSVSVVVATRDRPAALAGALDALRAAVGPDDEVIVVDSASKGSGTRGVAEAAGVDYMRAPAPGAARARNLGAARARRQVLAFTDDDCRPHHGWAAALAAAFTDPDVGLAVGPVTGVGGGSAADVEDRGPRRWRWPDDPAHIGSGASMAVLGDAFRSVGGFDERLGPGAAVAAGEDHELFLRLLHAGWIAAFVPEAVVDHDDRRSRWATLRLFHGYGIGAGTVASMARSLDPAVARGMLRSRLWDDGVVLVGRDLARRHEEPAARAAAMAVGVVAGRIRARRLRSRVPPRRDTDGSLDR